MRNLRIAALVAAALSLVGCSVASMSPLVQRDALDYDAAFDEFGNRVLVENILRARDYAPLNLAQLAVVHGSLQFQAGINGTGQVGPHYDGPGSAAANAASLARTTVTPSVQFTTSPTFDTSPLNTQGFTLNIIQPIAPMYIVSKWNGGISHKLLMMLFVKAIEIPKLENGRTRIYKFENDPDNPEAMRAFEHMVDQMLAANMSIKAFTVLDPVGPAFPFAQQSSSGDASKDSLSAYTFVTSLGDAQFSAGNAADTAKPYAAANAQLYRVYPTQVAICLSAKRLAPFKIYLSDEPSATPPPPPPPAQDGKHKPPAATGDFTLKTFDQLSPGTQAFLQIESAHAGGGGHHGGGGGGGATGSPTSGGTNASGSHGSSPTAAGGASSGSSSSSAISTSLQANRLSGVLDEKGCKTDEIVPENPISERDYSLQTANFAHVEWRSTAEVFQYLGALVRRPSGWREVPDARIATCNAFQDASAAQADACNGLDHYGVQRAEIQKTFALVPDSVEGRVVANYRGRAYSVRYRYRAEGDGPDPAEIADPGDHSLETLYLLSELVNAAKVSSDIPVTPQLQLIP